MMYTFIKYLCVLVVISTLSLAKDKNIHELIADSAFHSVLRELGTNLRENRRCFPFTQICLPETIMNNCTFGALSTLGSSDLEYCRFQEREKTVLDQLREIDSTEIAGDFNAYINDDWRPGRDGRNLTLFEKSGKNVIVNYLTHHLFALRMAASSGKLASDSSQMMLQIALYCEAQAQSYLIDAFAAGHLLVRRNHFFPFFNNFNTTEAHDYYGSIGVFVMNSQGDAWQTFDERLFEWYAPSFSHVFEASVSSLTELFLVYYAVGNSSGIPDTLKKWGKSQFGGSDLVGMVNGWLTVINGDRYLNDLRLPTLLLLPTPISATWSVQDGKYRRYHYPQVRDSSGVFGFHDIDRDGIDENFIYPESSIPKWLQPEAWYNERFKKSFPDGLDSISQRQNLTHQLIKHEASIASVRFSQDRDYPPAYTGILLHGCGGGVLTDNGVGFYSAGFGFSPPLTLIPDLKLISRPSIDISMVFVKGEKWEKMITMTGGVSFGTPLASIFEYSRVEAGYATEIGGSSNSSGLTFSVGFETPVLSLPFNYWGFLMRPKFQYLGVQDIVRSFSIELVVM